MIILLSSLLWRIRGGLWKEYIPSNKIWYAIGFSIYSCFLFSWNIENILISFITCYTSYQLYGWGLYIGRIMSNKKINPDTDKECELIDDLLYPLHVTLKGNKYYLYQYPRLFGFCGTTLTGLIITFLWGLYFQSIFILLSGLGMGLCYYLGYLLNKLIPEEKAGWGYGEYIFGGYIGVILSLGYLQWVNMF